jgi:hypothetical protein
MKLSQQEPRRLTCYDNMEKTGLFYQRVGAVKGRPWGMGHEQRTQSTTSALGGKPCVMQDLSNNGRVER